MAGRKIAPPNHDNLVDYFFDELSKGLEEISQTKDEKLLAEKIDNTFVEEFPIGFEPYNGIWRYEPVDTKYFFNKMIPEPLTPKQQEAVNIICGVGPFEFTNLDYEEADLMWGKGSGKDSTIAKAMTYQGYKLSCLIDPQKFLGLGKGSPIDIVNVASNSQQAKDIFFKYLTNFVKMCKDPNNGYNWFSTKNFWFDVGSRKFEYMDLREKEGDIKVKQIEFGRGITCHSLTSDRFTAEGLTIVLAVMDEIGALKPDKVFGAKNVEGSKMIGQYKSLGTSVRRSTQYGKLVCISYKYGTNCAMSMLVRKNEKDAKKFVRKYSVYEVRTDKKESELRKQFASDYISDPELAAMMYECKDPKIETDRLFSNIFVIKNCIDVQRKFTINPIVGGENIIKDISRGVDYILEPWFKGNDEYYYTAHIDLAKGQVWKGGDAIGLVLGHLQQMRVTYDAAWIEFYKQQYNLDLSEFQGQLRVGVVFDLAVQIICTQAQQEARIADIRKFVIDLQEKRKFGLLKVTLDRWGSEETLQEFNRSGIEAEQLSMDKSKAPFHTLKDYMQQGIAKFYANEVLERELEELIDTGAKVDHPEISVKRFQMEGVEHGSKDIADGAAGVLTTLTKELVDGGSIVFG